MVITIYEIFEEKYEPHLWASWVRILKQVSQVLLVAYSALNPVAYCGELVYQQYHKILKKWGYNTIPSCLTCYKDQENPSPQSELDVMKSVGITLNGADPLQQQLQELDIQSRILSGLTVTPIAI